MKRSVFAMLLLWLLVVACSPAASRSQVKESAPTVNISSETLRELAQKRGILIGAAVNMDALQSDRDYATVLAREFNVVTPENVMKFDALQPRQGVYTFAQGDALVQFAQAHAMQVRGHNLVWYRALPSWITSGNFSRDELLAILKDHIVTVVSHYRGQVNIWDVVNEAVNNDGSLRDSPWLRIIGPDYIDWAFRWAQQANPQAHLFYNDYGAEGLGAKSNAVYNLVKGLLQRGVPIYGVGLQMHTSIVSPPAVHDVTANIQRLVALGLKVQITEMDVQLQNDPRPLQARLIAQAQVYHAMLGVCLANKACEAFVMWGFTDRYSWIPQATGHADQPLIFDAAYRPKPVYNALVSALAS